MFTCSPKLPLLSLVSSLKGGASRLLGQDRLDIAECDYYQGVLWSPCYFAASCGEAVFSSIKQYIEQSNP